MLYLRNRYGSKWTTIRLTHGELSLYVVAAQECLFYCAHAAFWDWALGSRLLYWIWPTDKEGGQGMACRFTITRACCHRKGERK
jgi:hypothetical protein